jgi:hypothetical protein
MEPMVDSGSYKLNKITLVNEKFKHMLFCLAPTTFQKLQIQHQNDRTYVIKEFKTGEAVQNPSFDVDFNGFSYLVHLPEEMLRVNQRSGIYVKIKPKLKEARVHFDKGCETRRLMTISANAFHRQFQFCVPREYDLGDTVRIPIPPEAFPNGYHEEIEHYASLTKVVPISEQN